MCKSLALCQFPLCSRGASSGLCSPVPDVLLNTPRVLHEHPWPTGPTFRSTSPGMGTEQTCPEGEMKGSGSVYFPLGFQPSAEEVCANALPGSTPGFPLRGKLPRFPPGPQGSPGQGWRHGAPLPFRRRPRRRAPRAELSQLLEAARGWRHPRVQGGPREVLGAAGQPAGARPGASCREPAALLLSWLGLGSGGCPHPPPPGLGHLTQRDGAREQLPPPAAQPCRDAGEHQSIADGRLPTQQAQAGRRRAWFNVSSMPSLRKGRLWGDPTAACAQRAGAARRRSCKEKGAARRRELH